MVASETVRALLDRLRELRTAAGVSEQELERQLILGPGWIERFESGRTTPPIDVLLAILSTIGADLRRLADGHDYDTLPHEIARQVQAVQDGANLRIQFAYAKHDAVYVLPNATEAQFDEVLIVLRNGLARLVQTTGDADDEAATAIKADSVAQTFLRAVRLWPHANPSDIWWFLVSRAYCDGFNHPAEFARLDLGQSWKRTGGWALEEVMVRHYAGHLRAHGVELAIVSGARKRRLIEQLRCADRIESDKADVLLVGHEGETETCFGVVHVKASFAERRTDDVPMSRSLIEAGFCSPLWTMDCKSGPSASPFNKGELGRALVAGGDRRSAKRKDIEDDGYFSACFSYNTNTTPTPEGQGARARIHVCNFANPDDAFAQFVLAEWQRFRAE